MQMTAIKEVNPKTVGIVGGLSFHSTSTYYHRINEAIGENLPFTYGRRSAKMLIYSLDMEDINQYVWNGKYKETAQVMLKAVQKLQKGDPDFYIFASNTVHDTIPYIEKYIPYITFPYLHIADCCALKLKENNISCVGLIGTKVTMQRDFYIKRLGLHGIKVVVPKLMDDHLEIQRIILDELCTGQWDNAKSKDFLVNKIIRKDLCEDQGAQGCILGCTEFGLVVKQNDLKRIPLFDSADVHIDATIQVLLDQKKLTDFLPNVVSKL